MVRWKSCGVQRHKILKLILGAKLPTFPSLPLYLSLNPPPRIPRILGPPFKLVYLPSIGSLSERIDKA